MRLINNEIEIPMELTERPLSIKRTFFNCNSKIKKWRLETKTTNVMLGMKYEIPVMSKK